MVWPHARVLAIFRRYTTTRIAFFSSLMSIAGRTLGPRPRDPTRSITGKSCGRDRVVPMNPRAFFRESPR